MWSIKKNALKFLTCQIWKYSADIHEVYLIFVKNFDLIDQSKFDVQSGEYDLI